MSAVAETPDGPVEIIQVLFALHPGFGAQELCGPLEILSKAYHKINDPKTKAFDCTFAATSQGVTSSSGLTIKADIDIKTAHEDLSDYDVLIIPGGDGVETVLKNNSEPLELIKAFAKLQISDPSKERTLMSIGTGSLLLAQTGILQGMAATTHPDYYTKMEIICKDAARRGDLEQTDVMEENYVVNNARFELGDKLEENPFVLSKRPDGRRKSIARKGSNAWKESVKRRESNARRASLRLGGLRLITSGGITSGLDASLYLVAAMVSHESAQEVARVMQYSWNKGVTVEGIDVLLAPEQEYRKMPASRLCETCSSQLLSLYSFGFCVRASLPKFQSARVRRIAVTQGRTFTARSRIRHPDSQPNEKNQDTVQLAHTVIKARRTFGNTLPDNFLSTEEYKIYERLYGPPAGVTNPQDIGMLRDLVQIEEPIQDTGQNVIFREDGDGNLERVAYAPRLETGDGVIKEEVNKRAEVATDDVFLEAEHERTLDSDFDERFATYRDEVTASGTMNKSLPEGQQRPDDEQARMEEGLAEEVEEEMEHNEEAEEDVAEFKDPLDAYADTDAPRRHPLTAAGKWGTRPWTIQLPKDTFVDPLSAVFSEASNKHLTEVAHEVFGGKALPNSTATPLPKQVGANLKQSPIALEAFQSKMGEMEANAYLAAIMPGAYASIFSSLVEVRKRLGPQWLQDLLRKEGGPRVLDAGAGGAGVLAWREMLRNEWELMHPDVKLEDQRVPFGKSTVVTGSSSLRQRASTLLDNTTFLPRLPDYNPSVDHPLLEQGKRTPRKQYDVILAPYTLWTLQEDHMRKTQVQNLWSLLKPDGGVLIVLEKGVPRGFELVASAREVLLKYHIASPGDTTFENRIDEPFEGRYSDKETGMIIAPCTNHGKCPMYLFPGRAAGRRDYCHFMQRYTRPPFLQRLLGQNHSNHEDIRFSFVAVRRGVDLRQTEPIIQGQKAGDDAFAGYDQEEVNKDVVEDGISADSESTQDDLGHTPVNPLSFPRIILPPLKKRGHIIFDACTPAGKLERWTVPKSFGKRAYADARKARWGDLWALGAKTKIPRRLKIGGDKGTTGGRRRFEADPRDPNRTREVRGSSKTGKKTKKPKPKHKNKLPNDDIDI
ncbi:MAG: hypothetical protein Q9184_005647 [Pyrenodesmia sp. 2 TL-2023]